MSDTPRTDAITPMVTPDMMRRMRDLARELERENAELRAQLTTIQNRLKKSDRQRLREENFDLRQRLEAVTSVMRLIEDQRDKWQAQCEAAEKDAARYRWIKSRERLVLRSDGSMWTRADGSKFTATHYLAESYKQHAPTPDLDETIDAAMQEK